jgi:hypothetical protein
VTGIRPAAVTRPAEEEMPTKIIPMAGSWVLAGPDNSAVAGDSNPTVSAVTDSLLVVNVLPQQGMS